MAKRATPWKEGKIISIETRKGLFVLAQMLKSPYLRFYKAFRKDENWGKVDVRVFETLFVKGVVRQFLKFGNISVIKQAIPDLEREDEKNWIQPDSFGTRTVCLWENTENETQLNILGAKKGGSLIYRDINLGGNQDKKIILEEIPLSSDELINKYELTSLGIFPVTNERLYLCYKMDKNVDPNKLLRFDKDIPIEYKNFIDIISGQNKDKREEILDTYFR